MDGNLRRRRLRHGLDNARGLCAPLLGLLGLRRRRGPADLVLAVALRELELVLVEAVLVPLSQVLRDVLKNIIVALRLERRGAEARRRRAPGRRRDERRREAQHGQEVMHRRTAASASYGGVSICRRRGVGVYPRVKCGRELISGLGAFRAPMLRAELHESKTTRSIVSGLQRRQQLVRNRCKIARGAGAESPKAPKRVFRDPLPRAPGSAPGEAG